MHDPFPLPAPGLFRPFIQPLADLLALPTLPFHFHQIILAAFGYHIICRYLSPSLSRTLFPKIYGEFNTRTKLNWDVHVVSLAQSCFINALALWVMWTDEERAEMSWEERVWGYTGGIGMIQGFAAGYFLWDFFLCVNNVNIFGWGLLAHAVAALSVFSLGFRPFLNFYGPSFILYELSSPFLNFHWFFDKLHMTGSRPQWYNGIVLLASFFSCRLVWGTYQSIRVYQDVYAALNYTPTSRTDPVFEPSRRELTTMRYAGEYAVPMWLAMVYLGSNITLNALNFYWFGKMIETIKKRFQEKPTKKELLEEREEGVLVEGLIDSSTLMTDEAQGQMDDDLKEKGRMDASLVNGRSTVQVEKTEIRKRKG